MRFAVFSAVNDEALALLDYVRLASAPPTLIGNEDAIGYQLSLSLSSDNRDCGGLTWSIGAGPDLRKGAYDCKVDILLCPPGKRPGVSLFRQHIKDLNATIYFHLHSGVLLLKSHSDNKPVVYERGSADGSDLKLKSGDTCVLRRRKNYLHFGQYRFVLEFVLEDQDHQKFNGRLNTNLRHRYHGLRPSKLLNFTPTTETYTSWNVWFHRNIPETSIRSGVNILTGQPVAVKKLQDKTRRKTKGRQDKTTELNRQYMLSRLKTAHRYKDNPDSGLLGINDAWCAYQGYEESSIRTSDNQEIIPDHRKLRVCSVLDEQNEPPGCNGDIYYSMPLAEHNFRNLSWRRESSGTRLRYFYQTLLGLNELHEHKIVHGNIRPESLLILADTKCTLSADDHHLPKKAVISLYMRRIEELSASICVAPEVWKDLENLGTEADVWALAASWLFTFVQEPANTKMSRATYNNLKKTLDAQSEQGRIKEPFLLLLRRMLAWEPQDRPSAKDALEDETWKSILAQQQIQRDDQKRKRIEQMQHHPGDPKRARVLSPISIIGDE
jgi:serine/threonine protein kinase